MLKAGFIGAGGRAQSAHYPSLTRLDDVEVTAVCELDETILAQVAQEYNIPNTFTDHRDMLDKMDLDIVYCVMREAWVLQPALDCLNAGKHTFLEKPPGANSDQTQQMLDAAIANDVYAMVGFQRRYAAVTREAMRRVAAKGPVSLVTTTFNKQLLGGKEFTTTLWNDVSHVVDLLRYMAGGEPTEVTAYRDSFDGINRNTYTALIRFDNNATGVVFGNRASGGRVLRSELHGVGIGCYAKIPNEVEIFEDNQSQAVGGWEVDGVDQDDVQLYEGTLTMHQHFLDCVRNGEVPLTDLRDVIHSIHLVDQIEGELP
jgi:predicted dehydrogenase